MDARENFEFEKMKTKDYCWKTVMGDKLVE